MKEIREHNDFYTSSIENESTPSLLLSNPCLEGFY